MPLHEPIGSWFFAFALEHLKYSIPRMGNSRKAIRAIDPEDSTIQAVNNKATSSAREKAVGVGCLTPGQALRGVSTFCLSLAGSAISHVHAEMALRGLGFCRFHFDVYVGRVSHEIRQGKAARQ